VLCPIPSVQTPGFSGAGVQLLGETLGDSVVDLWSALKNLSTKIPSANPGAQPTPGNVTQQMLAALGAVAGSIPGLPSAVATAFRLIPYGGFAALAALDTDGTIRVQIANAVQSEASNLARAINAYAVIAPSAGSGGVILPSGTIASYENGVWRIAVPKAYAGSFADGEDLGVGVGPLIVAGSYKEVGTSPSMPANATSVTAADFKKATSTPFYKAWWFWTPVGVLAAGSGIWAWRRRKKRRK
jgi:hypothetical protein